MTSFRVHPVIAAVATVLIGSSGRCLLPAASHAATVASQPVTVELGDPVVDLEGPWRFHAGDDVHWAEPGFDDSGWESVDLTPPPGPLYAALVLTGTFPAWGARGHAGPAGC